jgi:hypothetical protein
MQSLEKCSISPKLIEQLTKDLKAHLMRKIMILKMKPKWWLYRIFWEMIKFIYLQSLKEAGLSLSFQLLLFKLIIQLHSKLIHWFRAKIMSSSIISTLNRWKNFSSIMYLIMKLSILWWRRLKTDHTKVLAGKTVVKAWFLHRKVSNYFDV